jgi:Ca2+-binding RTX toxin-like protein
MTAVDKQITELLTLWAGKTGVSATSANVGGINGINGQTFEVVQAFAGQDYVRNGTDSLIPDLDGSVYLHRAYAALAEHVKEVILVQSVLKEVFANSYYSFASGDVVMNDTLANILTRAENLEPTNAAQNKAYWGHIGGIVATHAAEFGMTESAVLASVNTKAGFTVEAYTTYLLGTSSTDKFTGTSDADVMDMLAGNDSVFAGTGNDTVLGGSGNDSLEGHIGNDRLDGGANNDLLQGGNDADIIIGGAGKDTATGGSGMDTFLFAATSESSSANATIDSITDFSVVDDTIDLNVMTFLALDTDGGLTEINELRTYYVAASNTTFIRSDQTNFEIGLVGANYTSSITNVDFMW